MSIGTRKLSRGINQVNRRVVQVDHNLISKRGMHHHLLVHLCLKIEASTMSSICRTSRLDQPSPKVIWHKEVVGILHVVGVVETTLVNVVMASWVASSAIKRGIT